LELPSFPTRRSSDLAMRRHPLVSIAPTCVHEHAYRYDSFDTKYANLNTQPRECKDSPLLYEGVWQMVWKIEITKDLRQYTGPANTPKSILIQSYWSTMRPNSLQTVSMPS